MFCRSQTPAFLTLLSLILACSGQDPTDRTGSASLAQGSPLECANFTLTVPASGVRLGESFTASVTSQEPDVEYDWDGEGLYIDANSGENASVRCAWPGWHTLSVSACGATENAQIHCAPATCSSFTNPNLCPGVTLSRGEPTDCPKTNVIVRYPASPRCPTEIPGERGRWIGGKLIDAPYGASDPRPQLCGYHWSAPPTALPDHRVLPGIETHDWQWDCPKVAAHGDYAALHEGLARHGQASLGQIEWTVPEQRSVRVAVIDTAANLWRDADNSPHGKAVGTLIRDTACADPANCRVQVVNYLGLPLLRDAAVIRRDVARGGAFGAHGDLARAIVEAVDAALGGRLVLNLSVAYDLEQPNDLPSTLLPPELDFENRVVLQALRYARCHGALIIAAAGNGRVPAHPLQTPGFPARWTALSGPDANTCARYQVKGSFADVPLLYAVSGVDFGDNPLLTTRGKGQSVLAALGFSVVRRDPHGGYTRPLTGSSMSAAAFTGIAASLWSHVPNLSADDLVRDLYEVSPAIATAAPFEPYRPERAPKFFVGARRINRCSIADTAHGVANCTSRPVAASAVPDSVVPDLPSDVFSKDASEPFQPPPGISPWDFPWIRPQPEGEPGCTSCSVKLRNPRLDLILRSSFRTSTPIRLLVKKPAALGIASFAGNNLAGDETVTDIASFAREEVPFTVDLADDLGTPTAAELAYQVEVDGVNVDSTESVLIEPDEEVLP